jgi:hypothetical protein
VQAWFTCATPRALSSEKSGVLLREIRPLVREIIEREDGRNRANRDARAAIYALHGIDVEHIVLAKIRFIFLGMDAIDRTGVHAGRIFGSDAGFRYNVSHIISGARAASAFEE